MLIGAKNMSSGRSKLFGATVMFGVHSNKPDRAIVWRPFTNRITRQLLNEYTAQIAENVGQNAVGSGDYRPPQERDIDANRSFCDRASRVLELCSVVRSATGVSGWSGLYRLLYHA